MTDTSLVAPPAAAPPALGRALRGLAGSAAIPVLAVFTALVVGAIFIFISSLVAEPDLTVGEHLDAVVQAYLGLWEGAFGDTGGLTRTLVKATPLIFSGLAVAFAFKGGLFNIGGQGQLIMGAIMSAWVGFAIPVDLGNPALSSIVHITLALMVGALAGALWGAIPGVLKAYTGAHEVITTIMFNFIAANLINWLVNAGQPGEGIPPGPFNDNSGTAIARTPPIYETARLPIIYDPPTGGTDLHLGIFIAIIVAIAIMLLVYRTTFGFELRMVGLNPTAARYAGVNVKRITVLTMVIAGACAGLAGAMQTMGVNFRYEPNQSLGLGFDAITVALLASNNPIGVIFAALLFGAMDAGGNKMQFNSGVPTEIILIIQALILMFVAANQIIRAIYRVKAEGGIQQALSTGWGQR